MRTITSYMEEIKNWADGKGWDDNRSFGDHIALMHSELSEALEEYRTGHAVTSIYQKTDNPGKPEGIPIELADVLIRIFHFCARNNVDLENALEIKIAYNHTRAHRHGGKLL